MEKDADGFYTGTPASPPPAAAAAVPAGTSSFVSFCYTFLSIVDANSMDFVLWL